MRTMRAAQVTARDTQKVWLIRQRSSPARSWCERCDDRVQTLTTGEAAALARTDPETIDSLVKLGKLHSNIGAGGPGLICLNSLL
jgi:hypothetical protein